MHRLYDIRSLVFSIEELSKAMELKNEISSKYVVRLELPVPSQLMTSSILPARGSPSQWGPVVSCPNNTHQIIHI